MNEFQKAPDICNSQEPNCTKRVDAAIQVGWNAAIEAAAEKCLEFQKDLGEPDIDIIEYGLGYHSGQEMAATRLNGAIRELRREG